MLAAPAPYMLLCAIIFTLPLAKCRKRSYNRHDSKVGEAVEGFSSASSKRKERHMCSNGINTGQFEQMIDQIDDHIKLERRWVHNLAHQAGDAGFSKTDDKLHSAQELLDEVRALLADAKDELEEEAASAPGVTVSLV